jgi:outer membrane protein OmpA-like peptidoglycan-associated protein
MITTLGLLSLAWAGQDALTFEVTRAVEHGKQVAEVTFLPIEGGRVVADLVCGDKAFHLDSTLSPGKPVKLQLAGLPEGEHSCTGEVDMQTTDGTTGSMVLTFQVASLGLLPLSTTIDEYDRANQRLVVHAGRPVEAAMASVFGAKGALLAEVQADLSDPQSLRFAWTTQGQPVVRVLVQARDVYGFSSQLELLPWEYLVPHEDVVFPSNSHELLAVELPKLERSWAEVAKAIELYGSVVPISLYVAGYTDTVGDGASNQGLSERRARAIAQWYRTRGFSGPVYYQGFGETVLAVPTGDSVDEQANRRAVYLLAAGTPGKSRDVPRADWKRL